MGIDDYVTALCDHLKLNGDPTTFCISLEPSKNEVEVKAEWKYRPAYSRSFTFNQWDAIQETIRGK